MIKYNPPAGIGRRMAFRELPLRRIYDLDKQIAVDIRLAQSLDWSGRIFDDVVVGALEECLKERIRRVIKD